MKWNDLSCWLEPVVFERSVPEHGVVGLCDQKWPGTWKGRARIAVLAHGVACTWQFMRGLGRDLERLENHRGEPFYAKVALLAYDWRRSVEDNATRLQELLADLSGRATVDLYGYSQGGIVVRRAVELAGGKARAMGVRHVFTFNAPHGGTPLAHVSGSFMRWSAGVLGRLAVWHCDGIRDLLPGSQVLTALGKPPEGVGYTFVAGNSGWSFLRGITQPMFGAVPNDGVASVESQLHAPAKGCAGVVAAVKSRIARLVYPWEHFSLVRGLTPSGSELAEAEPLETIASRVALAF